MRGQRKGLQALKAISLQQPWAAAVVVGAKTVETRTWQTKYRGPLLIHASLSRDTSPAARRIIVPAHADGHAAIIGGALLVDCRPMLLEDEKAAMVPYRGDLFAWVLADAVVFDRAIPYRGQLGLFDVPGDRFATLVARWTCAS